jgi:hypothetical protein
MVALILSPSYDIEAATVHLSLYQNVQNAAELLTLLSAGKLPCALCNPDGVRGDGIGWVIQREKW